MFSPHYYHQYVCNLSSNIYKGNSFFFIPRSYVSWTGWEDSFLCLLLEYFRSIGTKETKKILDKERYMDSMRRQDDLLRASLHFGWKRVKYDKDGPSFKDFTSKSLAQQRAAFVDMALGNLKKIKDAEAYHKKKYESESYYLKM